MTGLLDSFKGKPNEEKPDKIEKTEKEKPYIEIGESENIIHLKEVIEIKPKNSDQVTDRITQLKFPKRLLAKHFLKSKIDMNSMMAFYIDVMVEFTKYPHHHLQEMGGADYMFCGQVITAMLTGETLDGIESLGK